MVDVWWYWSILGLSVVSHTAFRNGGDGEDTRQTVTQIHLHVSALGTQTMQVYLCDKLLNAQRLKRCKPLLRGLQVGTCFYL